MFKNLFTGKELKGVIIILTLIITLTVGNLLISERKGRDAQRKQDLRDIVNALESFHERFGSYPKSQGGKILACDSGKKDSQGQVIFRVCDWGLDKMPERIPSDPQNRTGLAYYYLSTTSHFQIFASLEGDGEAEYDKKIVTQNLICGNRICNMGLASPRTPLDKSLQQYENELQELNINAARKKD